MCYSAKSSITAYIVGSIASILLFKYGDKYDKNIALFSLVFVQIQLMEFFIWIDQDCGKLNDLSTKLLGIILNSQVFSIILGMILYNTTTIYKNLLYLILLVLLINLITRIITEINRKKVCSKETKKGHLEWDVKFNNIKNKWKQSYDYPIYYLAISIPFLFFKNIKKLFLLVHFYFYTQILQ